MSSRRSPLAGQKANREEQALNRKEQFGFGNLVKEQEFRSNTQGEIKSLNDKIRELTDMLEDRKNANRLLTTENMRLKKLVADLQVQLLNKPTARGESAAMKSMRELAKQFQAQEQMTSAAAEQMVGELMAQNQAVVDEMARLQDERDGLQGELDAVRSALSSAETEVAAHAEAYGRLADEKEELVRRGDELEQTIAQLRDEMEALRRQLLEGGDAAEAARGEAEAQLRRQRAALEAEAQLRRQAEFADVNAQVAALRKELQAAHDTLASLNQTESLGPGWRVLEHGLPPGTLPPPGHSHGSDATAAAATQRHDSNNGAAAESLPRAPGPVAADAASVRSVHSARAGAGTGAVGTGAAGGQPVPPEGGSRGPGSGGLSRRASRTGSMAGSMAGELVHMSGHHHVSGDIPGTLSRAGGAPPDEGRANIPDPNYTPGQPGSRPASRAASVAASAAAMEGAGDSLRGSRAASVAGGSAAVLAAAVAARLEAQQSPHASARGTPRASEASGAAGPRSTHGSAAAAPGGDVNADLALGVDRAPDGHRHGHVPGSVVGDGLGGDGDGTPRSVRSQGNMPPGSPLPPASRGSVRSARTGKGPVPQEEEVERGRGDGVSDTASAGGQGTVGNRAPPVVGQPPPSERPRQAAKAGAEAGAGVGPAAKGLPTPQPAPAQSSRANVMELLLHDASLRPGVLGIPAADFWPALRLVCPALRQGPTGPGTGLVHAALGTPGSTHLELRTAHRVHYPTDQHLLAALAGDAVRVQLQNLKTAVVGGFSCPRLVAAAAAGTGAGAGEGVGPAVVADGTVERVLVVAAWDEHDCASLEMYSMDEEGVPTRHFQTLTAPWKAQLPDGTQPPGAHEFCINTNTLHRLQADAARACGLFDTAARVFIGRGDGATYQVWRLADADARRKATFRALNRVIVHPVDDPWAAAAPLASTALPLTAALTAPSVARLELANLRRLLAAQPTLSLYDASEHIGTKDLACRTGAAAGEKLLCVARVTPRLLREPEVSEQLLGALQPSLQAGSGAPALPPLHWLSVLGAEELQLGRLLGELREGATAACGGVMGLPALDGDSGARLRALAGQAADSIRHRERQLLDGLASCQAAVDAACAASPHEAQLARARMASVRATVARLLAETVVFFRQRVELYRLGAAAWHFITHTCSGPDDPVARLPSTTTPPQAQALAAALHDLAAALHGVTPPGASAVALLAAGGTYGRPLPLPSPTAAAADASGGAAEALSPVSEAARELETALRAAVDAAAAAASDEGEQLRRRVAEPGADDVALTEAAQVRLAAVAAPVTAALVQGLAGLCGAAVACSLAEADGAGAVRDQLAAAAAGAAALGGVVVTVPGAVQLQQLMQQLTAQVAATAKGAAAAGGSGAGNRGTAAQLNAALQSLQFLLGVVTRAAPPHVSGSPQSLAAWLKASTRLRVQLSVLATGWSVGAVAAAGHALLLGGQRHAAVVLALEVLGRELDRVLDATKAALDAVRANRSYDDAVLSACMPAVATALTSHAAAATTACFWLAAQLLITPLVIGTLPPPSASRPAAQHPFPGPASAAQQPLPHPNGNDVGNPGSAVTQEAGPGAAAVHPGVGLCYSASLHATSSATYTVMTLGTVGGTPTAATTGSRPEDPLLSPMSHPMLSTWQPHGCVLYLDLQRLNAAAAAVAAGSALPDGAPPLETPALPLLPAAAEHLGWSLKHADEYYQQHYAATAAVGKAAAGSGVASGGGALSQAPSVAGSVKGSHLAEDPGAALSEAKLAARMAAEADIVVLAGGRLAEAGSMVKWLTQGGALVLAAADLQLPGSIGGGGVQGAADARELARTLVALLATHHVQQAAARVLASGLSVPPATPAAQSTSVPPSGAATPRAGPPGAASGSRRASFAGAAAAAGAVMSLPPSTPPLQPLAVLTYLSDVSVAKPVLAVSGELTHRVGLGLQALQATFASAPQLQPHADMLGRHCSRLLAQQALLLEGLLLAPELLRARHPGTQLQPGGAVAAAVAALHAAGDGFTQALLPTFPGQRSLAGGAMGAGLPLSRQGSTGRLRPALPVMPPKSGTPRASQAGQGQGQGPFAAGAAMPVGQAMGRVGASAVAGGQQEAGAVDTAYSTESEDEEVGVSRVAVAGPGSMGGRAAVLPDEPDMESDAASIRSASTIASRRRA